MFMKKLLSLALALALCFSLVACGGSNADTDEDTENEVTTAATTEPEETAPSFPAMDMSGTNVLDGKAEVSFVRAYHTVTVEPPNPENKGTSFTAKDGEYYLVLHLNVTNTSSETKSVDDLFKVYLFNDDFGSATMSAVVEPEAHKLDRSYQLSPNESALVYFMVRCPDTTDLTKMNIEVYYETSSYIGEADFSTEFSYKEEAPKFAKGDVFEAEYAGNVITNIPGTTYTVTVADIYMTDSLQAPYAVEGSTYWPDQADSQFLIVKLSVKNTGNADLSYWNMAGMICKYNGTDTHDTFFVAETENGQNLTVASASMALAPQEENTFYFVSTVPNEHTSGPLELTLQLEKKIYSCTFPA